MKKGIFLFAVFALFMNLEGLTQEKMVKFIIHTDYGDIKGLLYNDTPQHRDNFVKLVNEGWYDGSPFHRVIENFMIQGGSNADGAQDPGYTVPAEILPGHYHKKGALAAARMPDQINPDKASSGSQFYIVQGQVFTDAMLDNMEARSGVTYSDEQREIYKNAGGTPHLDGGYTVFGQVADGFDVIDKIAAVQTNQQDRPVEEVKMTIEIID